MKSYLTSPKRRQSWNVIAIDQGTIDPTETETFAKEL